MDRGKNATIGFKTCHFSELFYRNNDWRKFSRAVVIERADGWSASERFAAGIGGT